MVNRISSYIGQQTDKPLLLSMLKWDRGILKKAQQIHKKGELPRPKCFHNGIILIVNS